MALTKDQILGLQIELPKKEVHIEGVPEPFIVRALSTLEMEKLLELCRINKGKNGIISFVCSVCDELGNLLFSPSDIENPKIAELPFFVTNPVCRAANEVNGINLDDDEDEE
jgi:hypothetical protein